MAIYFMKDSHERNRYYFNVTTSLDPITSVTYTQSASPSIQVVSCYANADIISDDEANSFPSGTVIVLTLDGGLGGTSEEIRIEYVTLSGLRLDEHLVVRVAEDA